jgi:DNA-binding response OmpR family regulator
MPGARGWSAMDAVDTHVLRLPQKLERDPERPVHFLTVHAQGYRFVA